MQPISCSCPECKAMCANSTCLPTPAEARELIRRGFGARLATYSIGNWPDVEGLRQFVGPAPAGREGARDLAHTRSRCTFLTADERCEVQNHKPLEGRLAHHARPWQPIRMHVAQHWRGKQFDSVNAALQRAN